MIEEKHSSIVRPRVVPPMFTPVLTPNSQPSPIMHTPPRTNQQALVEMSTILRKHDPEASRLHDCIGQVKVFAYNSTELRWENIPNIEGNLCAYERQQIISNKAYPSYAFAIINGDKNLIEPVTTDMAHHADKLRLFYEVARHGHREVFCAHFLTEADCLRLQTFLSRSIQITQKLAEQQQQLLQQQQQQQQQQMARAAAAAAVVAVPIADHQSWMQAQRNGQATPTVPIQQTPNNVYRQQQQQQQQPQQQQQQQLQHPIMLSNANLSTTPQFGSPRINMNQTPTRLNTSNALAAQQTIYAYPIDNNNSINQAPPMSMVPSAFVTHAEAPKPIEQTPFPPSPMTNGNNGNAEDPTLSLKRLLNIRGQAGVENLSLEDGPVYPKQAAQQSSVDLMPPSAFEPIAATPPSPVVAIGAERIKHRASNPMVPAMNREHFRHVLLQLIQNDDHFLDIIYQACLTYPPASQ